LIYKFTIHLVQRIDGINGLTTGEYNELTKSTNYGFEKFVYFANSLYLFISCENDQEILF